jgi:ubiquinone/menaquinone biosynthesis C-methylase UbiE
MLKQAVTKDKLRSILWVQGDGQQLPFRDSFFDCVYMTMVLHHIDNKEEALREIYRTVRKGGNCVVMTTSHSRIRKHVLKDFPGVIAIDLKRIPPVPFVKKVMREIGFRNVHYHPVCVEEEIPLDEYLERVRKKYISTLTLLSPEAFRRGFDIFQQKARKKYGTNLRRISGFVFVVGQK